MLESEVIPSSGEFKMASDQIKSPEGSNHLENKNISVKCRFCKSEDIVKKGFRKTENRGKIQRYICRDCSKSFCKDEGFYRMRNSESKITSAIDLYFSNLSSRKVRNHFRRHLEHNASHISILNWCRKYVLLTQKYIENLHPTLSGQYYADETEIDCEGRKDKFWCAVDWGTRFIPNIQYSLFADKKYAVKFIESIKQKNVPKYIQTDAANFYPYAFKNVFKDAEVQHRINNTAQTGKYNVRIETVFMKVKDRVDDFRGLKALWSAPILLNGIIIQHNFIESHTTTGVVPCELANLKMNLGQNRWLGLIRESAKNQ